MPKCDAVVAVAGWEERFKAGLRLDLESNAPSELVILTFEEYLRPTEGPRSEVSGFAKGSGVNYTEVRVKREPLALWTKMRETFSGGHWANRHVLVDISTMPREVIWWTFSSLRAAQAHVSYIYYKPREYSSSWLTRDTARPRLVYQHSGVSELGKDTCLLILTGFDADRAGQLIQFFEPRRVLMGLQSGAQFENQVRNVERAKQLLKGKAGLRCFDLDAYSADHGLRAIKDALSEELAVFNVVAASLGPKLSAVALYRLQREHQKVALAYVPSRQFSMAYSFGIGDPFGGVLASE
jgi:hypothetical protein